MARTVPEHDPRAPPDATPRMRRAPEEPKTRTLSPQTIDVFHLMLPRLLQQAGSKEEFRGLLKQIGPALFRHEYKSDPTQEELAELEKLMQLYIDAYDAMRQLTAPP